MQEHTPGLRGRHKSALGIWSGGLRRLTAAASADDGGGSSRCRWLPRAPRDPSLAGRRRLTSRQIQGHSMSTGICPRIRPNEEPKRRSSKSASEPKKDRRDASIQSKMSAEFSDRAHHIPPNNLSSRTPSRSRVAPGAVSRAARSRWRYFRRRIFESRDFVQAMVIERL
jgi:hypothetical protein